MDDFERSAIVTRKNSDVLLFPVGRITVFIIGLGVPELKKELQSGQGFFMDFYNV